MTKKLSLDIHFDSDTQLVRIVTADKIQGTKRQVIGETLESALNSFKKVVDFLAASEQKTKVSEPELAWCYGEEYEIEMANIHHDQLMEKLRIAITNEYPKINMSRGLAMSCYVPMPNWREAWTEEAKWLLDNQEAAYLDLYENGKTGKVWCKYLDLLLPILQGQKDYYDGLDLRKRWVAVGLIEE